MLMDVRESVLENGMRVVTASIPRVESVSVGLWAGVGSRHEPKRLSGISHAIEHMLFKGTARRSARGIIQAIEGRGGSINGATEEEMTCYYVRAAFDHVWDALSVLTDMYLNARMAARDWIKERDVIIEEIVMYRDQPWSRVHELLGEMLWVDHPLGRPISGYTETVERMGIEDMRRFKEAKYAGANTLVAFAGRVDHDKCVAKTERILGGMARGKRPAWRRVGASVRQERVGIEDRDTEQAHLAMGIRVFGHNDTRRHALRILNVILGENMSSRLFQIIRERHGLAYSTHSTGQLLSDSGVFAITLGLDKAKCVKALRLIVKELNNLKVKLVGKSELNRAKDYAVGQLRLASESTSSQMTRLAESVLMHGRFVPPEETIEAYRAVTAENIRDVAEPFFRNGNSSLALVASGLDERDKAKVAAELSAL